MGFIRSIGIESDYRSLPYQPWGKGNVERFFDTVCLQFSRRFTSYVGSLTGSKTSSKVEKDANKLLRQGRLVTMEECFTLFEIFLDEYHNRDHSGLREMGEKWTKPIDLFANADNRYTKAPPPHDMVEMLLMRAEDAYVSTTGIKRFGSYYMDYDLNRYIGSHVNIRWNPSDLSRLFVYDLDGRKICEAEKQPLLGFHGFSDPEVTAAHLRNQNRHLSDDRSALEQLRTPHEVRVGLPPVAGIPDFMVEAAKQKVLSMPQDTQYRQEALDRASRKSVGEDNPFYRRMADEALAILRQAE